MVEVVRLRTRFTGCQDLLMDMPWAVKKSKESGMTHRFIALAASKRAGHSQNGSNFESPVYFQGAIW